MDIHKPKAAHSWREFLIEIGTIICGILIALGLEQAVEAIHRDAEVREAREALADEMRENVARLKTTIQEADCLLPQFDLHAQWANGGPKPPRFRFYTPTMRTSTWESVSGTVVPHMPLPERVKLAAFYDMLGNFKDNRAAQLALHRSVQRYQDLPTLKPYQRDALLEILSQDRDVTKGMSGNAAFLIKFAGSTAGNIEPYNEATARLRSGVDWVCRKTDRDPIAPAH